MCSDDEQRRSGKRGTESRDGGSLISIPDGGREIAGSAKKRSGPIDYPRENPKTQREVQSDRLIVATAGKKHRSTCQSNSIWKILPLKAFAVAGRSIDAGKIGGIANKTGFFS